MGLLDSYLEDKVEDLKAKRELEQKLGHEVSDYDITSLSANIEAAEETPKQAPPAAAKPQIQLPPTWRAEDQESGPARKKGMGFIGYGILAVVGLLIVWGGAGFLLPEATYNKLNPFTPRPPAGAFPKTISDFQLSEYDYRYDSSYSSIYHGNYFESYYKKDSGQISYKIVVFGSPEEAQKELAAKSYVGVVYEPVTSTSERLAFVKKDAPGAAVALALGKNLVIINGANKTVTEFENALPYAAFGVPQPAAHDTAELEDKAVPAIAILQELNQNPAAAKQKYDSKYAFLTGIVADSGDTVSQRQVTVTPTPTPATYGSRRTRGISSLVKAVTGSGSSSRAKIKIVDEHAPFIIIELPADITGTVRSLKCVFDGTDLDRLKKLHAGDTVYFRGRISFSQDTPSVVAARLSAPPQ